MSNTVLEVLRTKHEEIELLEKAIAKAIGYKENNVIFNHKLNSILNLIT